MPPVLMRNADGQTIEVADADVKFYQNRGYEPDTEYGAVSREVAAPDDSLIGAANAGARGFWSGLTFGGSDVLSRALTTTGEREDISAEKAAHPIASAGGELAGIVAPAILSGGATLPESSAAGIGARALANTPAGLVGRFAAEGVETSRALGGVEGALKSYAYSGLEGAAQSAGSYVSDVALGDRDLTAEGLAGALGHGFEFGAAAGAVTHGVERGTIAARRLFARTEGKAAQVAEMDLAKTAQETLEAQEAAAEAARSQLDTARRARELADLQSKQARVELMQVKNELQSSEQEVVHGIPKYDELVPAAKEAGGVISQIMPADEILGHGVHFNEESLAKPLGPKHEEIPTISVSVLPSGKLHSYAGFAELKAAAENGENIRVLWRASPEHVLGDKLVSSASLSADAKAAKLFEDTKSKIAAGQVPGWKGPFTDEGLDYAAKREIAQAGKREAELTDAIREFDTAKAEMEAVQRKTAEAPSPARKGARQVEPVAARPAEVPTFNELKAHDADWLDRTVSARSLSEHGYYEPAGGHLDAQRSTNARRAIQEGQREPISLIVSPSGKVQIEGGRHRLAAAVELDAPIKAKWSYSSSEPSSDMVFRGSSSAQSPLERQLSEMKSKLDGGADIGTLSRESSAAPRSPRQIETAYNDAVERANTATNVAEKQMHLREAAALEEQLSAGTRGRSVVDDIGDMAPVMTRYERAAARVTELAGDKAPEVALAHAKAFREAEEEASRKVMDRTARAIDDATNPLTSPEGKLAKARGAKGQADIELAKAQAAEAEASIGARAAEDAAKKARTEFEAAQPVPKEGALSALAGMPGAHAIPVIGPMLSRYTQGKLMVESASRFIGRVPATKTARAAALAVKVKDKIVNAVDRSLGLIERSVPKARGTASAVGTRVRATLERRAFDDGEPGAPKGSSTTKLAAVRIREVAAAVAQPELVIAQVRRELRDVDDPDLIAATEKHRLAMYQHLNDTAPKGPPPNPFSKREWEPSPAEAARWSRRLEVANDPVAAFEALHEQCLTPEAADTLRVTYPKLFGMAQQRLLDRSGDIDNPVEYKQLLRNSLLFDLPLHDSLQPENTAVLRSIWKPPAPAAPPGMPAAPTPSIAGSPNLTALFQPDQSRRAMR